MPHDVKVSLIGLDTSHTIEFARRMQSPDCPPEHKVIGMRAVRCLRFPTPFQTEEEQDERQKQLEAWGIEVTRDFEKAVADCDAIMLEINDPAYHMEYFTRCADLGKPIFVDKPLADTLDNTVAMYEIAKRRQLRVFSASSLRFAPALELACESVPKPLVAVVFGALGKAPVGSSVIWYGVHAFEMLERAMGRGAVSVFARRDPAGIVAVVEYPEARRGIVELNEGVYNYGGVIRNKETVVPFTVDLDRLYTDQLRLMVGFFRGENPSVELEDAVEIMAMLEAADKSVETGQTERINW